MTVRILFAGTFQALSREGRQAKISRIERCVLSGQDQLRHDATLRERMRERRELDCFRPGADDKPDVYAIQLSP